MLLLILESNPMCPVRGKEGVPHTSTNVVTVHHTHNLKIKVVSVTNVTLQYSQITRQIMLKVLLANGKC